MRHGALGLVVEYLLPKVEEPNLGNASASDVVFLSASIFFACPLRRARVLNLKIRLRKEYEHLVCYTLCLIML